LSNRQTCAGSTPTAIAKSRCVHPRSSIRSLTDSRNGSWLTRRRLTRRPEAGLQRCATPLRSSGGVAVASAFARCARAPRSVRACSNHRRQSGPVIVPSAQWGRPCVPVTSRSGRCEITARYRASAREVVRLDTTGRSRGGRAGRTQLTAGAYGTPADIGNSRAVARATGPIARVPGLQPSDRPQPRDRRGRRSRVGRARGSRRGSPRCARLGSVRALRAAGRAS